VKASFVRGRGGLAGHPETQILHLKFRHFDALLVMVFSSSESLTATVSDIAR
jgi:hypothetical protein